MSLKVKKTAKVALPSDQKIAKIAVKHFGIIKQHLLECDIFRNFVNQEAEDDAEDMFEDEDGFDIIAEDSDEDEEEQQASEDEDIDIDSDEGTTTKPLQKKPLPKKANMKDDKSSKATAATKATIAKKAQPAAQNKKPVSGIKPFDSEDESGDSDSEEESADSDDVPTPNKKKNGDVSNKASLTPKNQAKKPAVSTPHPKSAKKPETSTPATGAKKRPQPGSDPKSTALVKKVNLKDDKSLEATPTPAKKAKLDVKNDAKKSATSSKFFVEHESDSDSGDDDADMDSGDDSADSDEAPASKKTDNGQAKGFWKGKVGGDAQKKDFSSDRRGGMNQRGGDRGGRGNSRGGRGNFGNDRGGRFSSSPRGFGGDRGGRFNGNRGNSSFRGGDRGGRGGDRGGFGGRGRGSPGGFRGRGGDRGGFGGRGGDRGGFGGRGGDRGGRGRGSPGGFGGRGRGDVHPSWQAKQQQRQNQSGAVPQGKRVIFDD